MNNSATSEKMRLMRLHGMRKAFETSLDMSVDARLTNDDLVAYLIEAEWTDRQDRRFNNLLVRARFKHKASMAELDYKSDRNLDKNQLHRLADCGWIEKHRNILITGPTGAGKSYLASALGHQACMNNYRVFYANSVKLFSRLKMAEADGTYGREIRKIQRADVFILDDFGLNPMDRQNSLVLLEILEDRNEEKSTIITSQLSVKNWHQIIGEPAVADAICDRLVHTAIRIDFNKNGSRADSMRKKNKKVDES
jgi:DNA replication protein DnaC